MKLPSILGLFAAFALAFFGGCTPRATSVPFLSGHDPLPQGYRFAEAKDHAPAPQETLLPPPTKAQISADQRHQLQALHESLLQRLEHVRSHRRSADVAIFVKALQLALDFDEWYDDDPNESFNKALTLAQIAESRLQNLEQGRTPWLEGAGMKVLGHYSRLDLSPQPYVLEVPPAVAAATPESPIPAWVFLHGRFPFETDLYFIYNGIQGSTGMRFRSSQALVVHPFGRHCNAFKGPGEIDVFEALADAQQVFPIDPQRVSLLGYSMGGAGAWHLGAHHADRWNAVVTGGGFVDVKNYLKLQASQLPDQDEQQLWKVYDVPPYALNFRNTSLLCYDGAKDGLRAAGDQMASVLQELNIPMKRMLDEEKAHGFSEVAKQDILRFLENSPPRSKSLNTFTLQSRSQRYTSMEGCKILEVDRPWENTQLEAEVHTSSLVLKVENIKAFQLDLLDLRYAAITEVQIDGDLLPLNRHDAAALFALGSDGAWKQMNAPSPQGWQPKAGGTCIDDAFQELHVHVLPDRPGRDPWIDRWVAQESQHAIQRWRSFYRGAPLVVSASQYLKHPIDANLILWGDDQSNPVIAKFIKDLPLQWQDDEVFLASARASAKRHVPKLLHPYRDSKHVQRYLVLNSGVTFGEAHDRTNALQTPKLPDWALMQLQENEAHEIQATKVASGFAEANWHFHFSRP